MKRRVGAIITLLPICLGLSCGNAASDQGARDRFFNAAGFAIRYQVTGTGPPVVLIHGFGETLESWQRTGVVQALSPHFRVITFDVRGHGLSDKPHDLRFYGRELSDDVVRLLRRLRIPRAHIVGYSLGALIALDFAVLHQEHALSVVLGGAGWSPPEAIDNFRRQADAFEEGSDPVDVGDDPLALAALMRTLRAWNEEDVRRIRVPMAALIGANDRFTAHVERLSTVLPGTHVVVIPAADHATAQRDPRFLEALLAFLLERKRIDSGEADGVAPGRG